MIEWQIKLFNDLSPEVLYSIMRLRQEVFVVEQNCPYVDADGKDFHSYHLTGFMNNELVAYARLVFPGISYDEVSIGRVVTSIKHRRKEFGKKLMQKAIEEIERLYGKVPIRIQAQQYLKKFYEGFGFTGTGEPFLEDGIPHIIMVRSS